jgi:transposase
VLDVGEPDRSTHIATGGEPFEGYTMSSQPSSQERRHWLQWHFAHGENVSQTCRQFGISRTTLYRWLARYDAAAPSKPLRARSRRPQHTSQPQWTNYELCLLSELAARYPQWGRRRLQEALARQTQEEPRSASTVGRMLHRIAERCPVCGKTGGTHSLNGHFHAQLRAAYNGPGALAQVKQRRPEKSGDPEMSFLLIQAEELASGWARPRQGHEEDHGEEEDASGPASVV